MPSKQIVLFVTTLVCHRPGSYPWSPRVDTLPTELPGPVPYLCFSLSSSMLLILYFLSKASSEQGFRAAAGHSTTIKCPKSKGSGHLNAPEFSDSARRKVNWPPIPLPLIINNRCTCMYIKTTNRWAGWQTIRAASSEFGTYRLCEQWRFRRACAPGQSHQNLRCSLIQAVSQVEPSDRKPDSWPLWMAGHAQWKFVMTECSKTQIHLTGLIKDFIKTQC